MAWWVELAVGRRGRCGPTRRERRLVLRVRGLGYIGDDADDGASLLAGQEVVTDRVGSSKKLDPSAALTRATFSVSAVTVVAEEAPGERRDA
jgi:hypothetical protein